MVPGHLGLSSAFDSVLLPKNRRVQLDARRVLDEMFAGIGASDRLY